MSRQVNRRRAVPRTVLLLLLVAGLALGGLWLGNRRQTTDHTHGGVLFPVAADEIEGLLLTSQGMQYQFDRLADDRWSLSGATSDYLDSQAMQALVAVLPTAMGGAILPGTETEDRRYSFNGPQAMRLRVFLAGGRDISLALGALNPVTGNYYGSGAGREGCFPVAGPFRDKLFMLPATVQAKTLLPAFEREQVRAVTVTRSGAEHRLVRRDGRWWLRRSAADWSAALRFLPPLVQDYQAVYADRRREDDDGLWILASQQAVGQLIYEVSEIIVRDIKSPRESSARLEQWGLAPPWRQVVLAGPGLNPDPGAPVADQYTIAFGTAIDTDRVPALRRGNVLVTDFEAVNLLDQGLEVLIEQFALNDVARRADRLHVEREGRLLLDATRTGVAVTDEGRKEWRTVFPGPGRENLSETARHGFGQDLVVNLNRVEILAVLAPTSQPGILQDQERVRIRLVWGTGSQTRELVLETGFLATERLPRGGRELARTPSGGPAVGLWFPETGKLLQIPDHLVVTARNLAPFTKPVRSR